jgi:hypothetical protein
VPVGLGVPEGPERGVSPCRVRCAGGARACLATSWEALSDYATKAFFE